MNFLSINQSTIGAHWPHCIATHGSHKLCNMRTGWHMCNIKHDYTHLQHTSVRRLWLFCRKCKLLSEQHRLASHSAVVFGLCAVHFCFDLFPGTIFDYIWITRKRWSIVNRENTWTYLTQIQKYCSINLSWHNFFF